jgi:hypothetical protein
MAGRERERNEEEIRECLEISANLISLWSAYPIRFPIWFAQLAIAENHAANSSCTLRLLHENLKFLCF